MRRLRRIAFEGAVVFGFACWAALLLIECVYLYQIADLRLPKPRDLAGDLEVTPELRNVVWASVERTPPAWVWGIRPWTLLWQFRPWQVEPGGRTVRGLQLATATARSVLAQMPDGSRRQGWHLRFAATTIWMSRKGSGDELVAAYANRAYLANGVYGFGDGARFYFGKPLARLDLGELALLAAIREQPSRYNPWANAEATRTRRDLLLERMIELGVIGVVEAEAARRSPPPRRPAPVLVLSRAYGLCFRNAAGCSQSQLVARVAGVDLPGILFHHTSPVHDRGGVQPGLLRYRRARAATSARRMR